VTEQVLAQDDVVAARQGAGEQRDDDGGAQLRAGVPSQVVA
jgi:hypothetical protein